MTLVITLHIKYIYNVALCSDVGKPMPLVCDENYKPVQPGLTLECKDGLWKLSALEIGDDLCLPVCEQECLNGGTCVEPNVCQCPDEFFGPTCQFTKCPESLTDVEHGNFQIRDFESGDFRCDIGYVVPGTSESRGEMQCTDGTWLVKGTEFSLPADAVTCVPHCDPACQNGGNCTAPNTCSCLPDFTGKICETKVCHLTGEGHVVRKEAGKNILRCDTSKFLVKNESKVEVVCVDGVWLSVPDQTKPSCRVGCEEPCQNGGVCVGIEMCHCMPDYFGRLCEHKKCPSADPDNGIFEIHDDSSATLTCDLGFSSPTGKNPEAFTCALGDWTTGSGEKDALQCISLCSQACQNGGKCIGKDECQCPVGFSGTFCENNNCDEAEIKNGVMKVMLPMATVQCDAGYFLPNGETSTAGECVQGRWIFSELSDSPTTCIEGCKDAPCLNGGICIGLQLCQCPPGYTGQQCETKLCSDEVPPFLHGFLRKRNNTINVHCDEGYELPKSWKSGDLDCINGEWLACTKDGKLERPFMCMPKCSPPCENGGVCSCPGKCDCPPEYAGPTCAFTTCTRPPPPVEHASLGASAPVYPFMTAVSCENGYFLQSGEAFGTIICTDGTWHFLDDQPGLPLAPMKCFNGCPGGCLNGGICFGVGVCSCSLGYEGKNCELKSCFVPDEKDINGLLTESSTSPGEYLLKCYDSYRLMSGETSVPVKCVDSTWRIASTNGAQSSQEASSNDN